MKLDSSNIPLKWKESHLIFSDSFFAGGGAFVFLHGVDSHLTLEANKFFDKCWPFLLE